jgi:cytochrome bd ubiquinol oxidase subunit II
VFAAFPLAFAIIMPALYFPILALLRLIFRGVAFEFRPTARTKRKRWERAFFLGFITAAT